MTFHSPGPLITLLPPEQLATKIHLEFILAIDAYGCINIVGVARDVYAGESVCEAEPVPSKEYGACGKFATKTNRITWRDDRDTGIIIATTVRILEEFPKVVKVQASTEPIPAWKAPEGIRLASRAYRANRQDCWCGKQGERSSAPMAMTPCMR